MRSLKNRFPMRATVLAVRGAVAALAFVPAAYAAEGEDAIRELTQPTSVVEVGGLYVNRDSAKFGEYTGLDKKGGYAIGNVELYGGDGPEGAFRWKVLGINLGLDSRSLTGEAGAQGRWRVTAGYDEIVRNFSDTYQTFWNGAGSSTFTLPSGYPAASTRLAVTNNANAILANWNNIQSPNAIAGTAGGGPAFVIPANMHSFDIGTERKRGNVGVSAILAPGWEVRASVKHEEKDGTKITGVNIGRFSGVSALLPEPINSTTDQFEAGVSYAGRQAFFNAGYYGSLYRNDVGLWTVENPGANNAVLGNIARLQSYPDNQMHQLNVGGGYKFSPATRFSFSGSWARLTQNENFIDSPAGSTWVVPESSAHAKVINSSFLARLTSRVMKELTLNAAYKYDDRDNRTPVAIFRTTAGDTPGASTEFSNEPVNRKVNQLNLDADYSLGRGQAVKAEYEYQKIHRSSTAEGSPFRADTSYDNTLRVQYRRTLDDSLTGRVSYAHSRRHTSEYEEGDTRPTSPPSPLPAADPLLTGFEQFFLADRNRDKLRSQLNFQASDALSVQASLDYNRDHYPAQYGLKESKSWVFGLDGALVASKALSFTLFYTYEDMKTSMDSLAIGRGLTSTNLVPHVAGPPCAAYTNVANTLPADYATDSCRQWTESQGDKIHTLGIGARYRGLMAGRLELLGELTYSRARTPITVMGGTYYSNGVPSSPTGNVFIAAESFSDITSELTQLRLAGVYAIDKKSSVRITYMYGRLKSSDWAYDAYAQSALGVLAVQNFIGPGITSPNYNVNVVGVSYNYRFR
ncbi:MAG: MtrB/PioB family decaheme-associated outer membrane protein [Usitatibacter sp.]